MVLLGLAAVQLVVLSSVWPGFLSPNEASRVFAAHAFVTRGNFEIDRELAARGSLDDVSVFEGRHYSNKAPGLIWAAVPVIAAVHLVNPDASIELEQYVSRVVLVSGMSLLAAALVAGWAGGLRDGRVGGSELVFILLFASVFGVYAGTFFSHAWTGSLLLVAAWLLLGPGQRFGARGEVAAGFLIALAAVSEYPAALIGAVLGLAAGWGDWRRLARLAVGGLLPLAALAAYNHACFGSALTLSSRMEALPRYQRLAAQTFFGFSLPRPMGLVGLLVSPLLGLFFLFPVLLPVMAAPVAAWRRGQRRMALVLASAAWLLPVVMSAYREWAGGASFGPRYLVLGLPLAVLGMGYLEGRAVRWWVAGALLPSAMVALAGRLVPPFAIDGVWTASTLRGWVIPALGHGLWNGPPGAHGPVGAAVTMAIAVAVWLLALGIVFARWEDRPRGREAVGTILLTAVLLAVQLGAGTVTERQRAWLRYVTPAFTVAKHPISQPWR